MAVGPGSVSTTLAADERGGPVLDETVVRSLVADLGDSAFVAETARLYLAELDDRVHALGQAASVGELAQAAHTLKSASALLGLARLADACNGVEHAARHGTVAAAAVAAVPAEAEQARVALARLLTRDPLASPR